MNQPNQPSELEFTDVLEEIFQRDDALDAAALRRWSAIYPQFARELSDYAAFEIAADFADDAPEDAALTSKSREIVRDILNEKLSRRTIEPIRSIKAQADSQKLTIPDVARRAGLSKQLLIALEQRSVKPATIRPKVIARLAAALDASIDSVRAYFELPPQMIAGTSYKSAAQPEIGAQQDFAELVRADGKLTDAEKRELLD